MAGRLPKMHAAKLPFEMAGECITLKLSGGEAVRPERIVIPHRGQDKAQRSKRVPPCALADLDQQTALPPEMRELLRDLSTHWAQVSTAIDACGAISPRGRRARRS